MSAALRPGQIGKVTIRKHWDQWQASVNVRTGNNIRVQLSALSPLNAAQAEKVALEHAERWAAARRINPEGHATDRGRVIVSVG